MSKLEMPRDKSPAIKLLMMPEHTNPHGNVFGGFILAQMDVAGSIPAVELTKGRVVTRAVNSAQLKFPVFSGDLVSFFAEIQKTGNSSVTVRVEVYSQRGPAHKDVVHAAEAEFIYVAVDDNGTPRMVAAH